LSCHHPGKAAPQAGIPNLAGLPAEPAIPADQRQPQVNARDATWLRQAMARVNHLT
jgi:hypothetical protein